MRRALYFLLSLSLTYAASAAQTFDSGTVGEVRFPNSGKPEAQKAFLYGLAQLHNFEYDDAASAFVTAETIDPKFAMAFWGEAMTRNHPIWFEQDRDAAAKALKKLADTPQARLALAGTPREKSYLQAVEILFGEGTKEDRDVKYAEAMRVLAQTYPDDENAQTFFALALMGTAHDGRDIPTYMRAAAILEEEFHRYPGHPGAAHYLIHSVDDPVHAILGLQAARAYSTIAPQAAHAQHMTSHIFLALGMWDDVVRANEIAVRVVNSQRMAAGKPASLCGHYNEWLEYGYLEQGRIALAKQTLEKCRTQSVADAHLAMHGTGSHILMWSRYLFDTNEWKSELARWQLEGTPSPGTRLTYEFTRAFGEIRRGEMEAARETLVRFEKARKDQTEELDQSKSTETSTRKRAEIFDQQVQALLLASAGNRTAAIELLRTAARTEDSLPSAFGPPTG